MLSISQPINLFSQNVECKIDKYSTWYVIHYFWLWSRCLQDRRADLSRMFQEDLKWTATKKLSLWFLNCFNNVTFSSGPWWTKLQQMKHGNKIRLSWKLWFWLDNFSTKCRKSQENLSVDGWDLVLCMRSAFKHIFDNDNNWCQTRKFRPATHCMVLPPGAFNSMIQGPLPVAVVTNIVTDEFERKRGKRYKTYWLVHHWRGLGM